MTEESIRVGLVGFGPRSRKILARIISTAETPRCEIVDWRGADVIIVDRDGELAEDELLALYQHAQSPLIVLSETPVRGPNLSWVIKPVQSRLLLQTIWKLGHERHRQVLKQRRERLLAGNRRVQREVAYQLRHRPLAPTAQVAARASRSDASEQIECGAADEAFYLAPRLPESLRYDPRLYLQSVIQAVVDESRRRKRAVVVRGLGRDIIVFDGGRRIVTELSNYQLRTLCESPIDRKMLVFLQLKESVLDLDAMRRRAERAEAVLWKAAAWASRGRLPQGADPDRPVSIAAWPNLTRLARFPHVVQLAALWHRQAISIRATAALLDISPRYVFCFYSACLQLGLIREHARPQLFGTVPGAEADRGLLGKVLGYLRRRLGGES